MVTKLVKRTVFLVATPFLIWTGIWTVSAFAIEQGISLAVDSSEPQVQLEVASVSGYPQNFSVGISNIVIGDKTSFKWATKEVNLEAKSYLPNKINLDISEPHSFTTPFGSLEVHANVANLGVFFQPNFQLALGHLEGIFESVSVSFSGLANTRIDTVSTKVEASRHDNNSYSIIAKIKDFDLSNVLVDLESQYQYIQNLSFTSEVQLTQPLDRHILYQAAPKVKLFTLREALINYGSTSISINGQLAINDSEALNGNFTLEVQGWEELFNLAKEMGLVKPELEKFFYRILSDISKQDGSQDTLNLPLTIRNNAISYGALTLGVLP